MGINTLAGTGLLAYVSLELPKHWFNFHPLLQLRCTVDTLLSILAMTLIAPWLATLWNPNNRLLNRGPRPPKERVA